jgi:hypothetical protein
MRQMMLVVHGSRQVNGNRGRLRARSVARESRLRVVLKITSRVGVGGHGDVAGSLGRRRCRLHGRRGTLAALINILSSFGGRRMRRRTRSGSSSILRSDVVVLMNLVGPLGLLVEVVVGVFVVKGAVPVIVVFGVVSSVVL